MSGPKANRDSLWDDDLQIWWNQHSTTSQFEATSQNNFYINASKKLLKEKLESTAPITAGLGEYFKYANDNKDCEDHFSDFQIICDDGKEERSFNVHRMIIAAGSPVFRAMLSNDCKEKAEKSVIVSDT